MSDRFSPGLAPVLDAARALHGRTPALAAFAPWPDDVRPAELPNTQIPAVEHLRADPAPCAPGAEAFVNAVKTCAPACDWRITYREDEVGHAFVTRYGWFELIGPTGHYHSTQLRVAFGYWGPGLTYPLHAHEAEEIYFVAAGRAAFWTDTNAPRWLDPGDSQSHHSQQPHAFRTGDEGLFTLILWRGPGMGGRASLSTTSSQPSHTHFAGAPS
ncbi:MAG: dimethylsulfonioproprionate lyase family protein [Pseudomonadota bacterium]